MRGTGRGQEGYRRGTGRVQEGDRRQPRSQRRGTGGNLVPRGGVQEGYRKGIGGVQEGDRRGTRRVQERDRKCKGWWWLRW